MTLQNIYQARIKENQIQEDSIQSEVVRKLEALSQALVKQTSFFDMQKRKWCRAIHKKQLPVKGLYLWGGVGRGKTFLMDLFYHSLPFEQKTRYHFHRFMQYIHHALKKYQGKSEPLKWVAREFAGENLVLCFDEFYVSDIADAMILGELFTQLFALGVTLVATSNLKPEDLYYNGLQRDKFLPAISLITQHTEIFHLSGPKDYRLQYLSLAKTYHYPLDEKIEAHFQHMVEQLSREQILKEAVLIINDRAIPTRVLAHNIVWFSFEVLCNSPRGSEDYIEIARSFDTVLLSDVQVMGSEKEDFAKRFVIMVDEFYDRNVTLIISAQSGMTELYQGNLLTFEFERTISRLTEMQSIAYLEKPHLA